MSFFKRFLLLGSLGMILLAGLMFTSYTLVPRAVFANGCNNPAQGRGSGPYYVPTWTNNCQISEGNISNYVYAIQEIANASGCNAGPEDGDFGPQTNAGVKCFQKVWGFPPNEQDGIVGSKTWGAMAQSIIFEGSNAGWDNYSSDPHILNNIDFRMWDSSKIWYVYVSSDNEWCQMNLSSPC